MGANGDLLGGFGTSSARKGANGSRHTPPAVSAMQKALIFLHHIAVCNNTRNHNFDRIGEVVSGLQNSQRRIAGRGCAYCAPGAHYWLWDAQGHWSGAYHFLALLVHCRMSRPLGAMHE